MMTSTTTVALRDAAGSAREAARLMGSLAYGVTLPGEGGAPGPVVVFHLDRAAQVLDGLARAAGSPGAEPAPIHVTVAAPPEDLADTPPPSAADLAAAGSALRDAAAAVHEAAGDSALTTEPGQMTLADLAADLEGKAGIVRLLSQMAGLGERAR